jgi:hypothetical protein
MTSSLAQIVKKTIGQSAKKDSNKVGQNANFFSQLLTNIHMQN